MIILALTISFLYINHNGTAIIEELKILEGFCSQCYL